MTVLLACSGGGHLKQLHRLVPRLGLADEDRLWVTFDTGLSRSLLHGEDVVFATYAAPRDTLNVARNVGLARRLLKERSFSHAVSTGSSLAVCFLPLAARRGTESHFIETAARASGPSLTGRLMQRVPSVVAYTQYQRWAGGPWNYGGSVFDGFAPAPATSREKPIRRAVVTLGTTESYGFRRLVESLAPLLAEADVLWQTGSTDTTGLGVSGQPHVPSDELEQAVREADVVVAHAGTGAALTALEHGKCPLLVPRRAAAGEHVDDHQLEIARELDERGLAVWSDADDLTTERLQEAARRRIQVLTEPPPFRLLAQAPPHAA